MSGLEEEEEEGRMQVLVASLPPGLVPIIGTPVPGDDDKGAPMPTPRKMATKTGEGKSAAGGTSGK